ncbi:MULTISPECIES: hypothetical protein [unclassified Shewanella]|uniref:hypothetical protein n=1 Tax=unclassified Shewanella TaxID=196818 RepID=UPI000C844D62|nr:MULTISPECIES: hypothetical protein [unclassified Shewanella]MDO6776135.1 hypothetical protein [Shewanella sp. 3_MG-2023]PMG28728.1 hypothetical protein BCU94_16140 [Shewanella sp. 10N.286.52.C2]PMG42456.1 hypothetical protein BCU91_08125 [Shewanella sp. 10N.286.52.B9]
MFLMNFKDRWRATELSRAIEVTLKSQPVWLQSSNSAKSIESICNKLSVMVIHDYRRLDVIPKQLTEKDLLTVFFNGFSILINKNLTGETLVTEESAIIDLARDFAVHVDLAHDQQLINHAEAVIQLSHNLTKKIRHTNQNIHN